MKSYYCDTCGEWFRAKAQIDINHHHPGFAPSFMLCEPVGLKIAFSHIGVKPIYEQSKNARWRAILIDVETGYSQTPSWGHDAGGWIHYSYETMRDLDGEFIEAPTKESLISKLKAMPNVEDDTYFKIKQGVHS